MNTFTETIIPNVLEWLKSSGLQVALIIVISLILSKIMNRLVDKAVRKLVRGKSYESDQAEWLRENTLIKIFSGILRITLWVVAAMMILHEFGVPIAPLLTGAGILGVAVGFGSQSLVKDVISGLFILVENQFRIGDIIAVGEFSGTVENMTLRTTQIRDLDGVVHYVPNGEIKIASNKSKDFSKVNFIIGVGYHTDIDFLEEIINEEGDRLSEDEEFGPMIIEPLRFLRIDDFGDFSINVRLTGKVKPGKQYAVTAAMRRRLKEIFEKHNIEIPFPTTVEYQMPMDPQKNN
jgi:small conductance mechanosensitive channel